MSELKPCPFCGGKADAQNTYAIGVWEAFCTVCGAHTGYPAGGCTEAEAIEAWNRRANDALERPYYAADLRRAFSDMMERCERRDGRSNDA